MLIIFFLILSLVLVTLSNFTWNFIEYDEFQSMVSPSINDIYKQLNERRLYFIPGLYTMFDDSNGYTLVWKMQAISRPSYIFSKFSV